MCTIMFVIMETFSDVLKANWFNRRKNSKLHIRSLAEYKNNNALHSLVIVLELNARLTIISETDDIKSLLIITEQTVVWSCPWKFVDSKKASQILYFKWHFLLHSHKNFGSTSLISSPIFCLNNSRVVLFWAYKAKCKQSLVVSSYLFSSPILQDNHYLKFFCSTTPSILMISSFTKSTV